MVKPWQLKAVADAAVSARSKTNSIRDEGISQTEPLGVSHFSENL